MKQEDGLVALKVIEEQTEYKRDHELKKRISEYDHWIVAEIVVLLVVSAVLFSVGMYLCMKTHINAAIKTLFVIGSIALIAMFGCLLCFKQWKIDSALEKQYDKRTHYAYNNFLKIGFGDKVTTNPLTSDERNDIGFDLKRLFNFALVHKKVQDIDLLLKKYSQLAIISDKACTSLTDSLIEEKSPKRKNQLEADYKKYHDEYKDMVLKFEHELYLICQPFIQTDLNEWHKADKDVENV